MTNVIDMTNQKIGKLLVIQRDYNLTSKEKKLGAKWICQCDCGKIISIRGADLRSSKGYRSCGCSKLEHCTTHNLSHSPEYESWKGMKRRCYNTNNLQYKDYGGRGITICESWLKSFENFYNDMGPKPHPDMSIERLDNNKGYEPGNCKWATRIEQNRNRNYNKISSKQEADQIRHLYKTGQYTQLDLAKMFNCDEPLIWSIINNRTWT